MTKIIIALLPIAAASLLLSGRAKQRSKARQLTGSPFWIAIALITFLVGLYDGFFGPGTGTFLIIAFALIAHMPLINATATAKIFNFASNAGAFGTFIAAGAVAYPIALTMAAANIAGNLLGSHLALRHEGGIIKKCLFLSLAMLLGYLVWKYY